MCGRGGEAGAGAALACVALRSGRAPWRSAPKGQLERASPVWGEQSFSVKAPMQAKQGLQVWMAGPPLEPSASGAWDQDLCSLLSGPDLIHATWVHLVYTSSLQMKKKAKRGLVAGPRSHSA